MFSFIYFYSPYSNALLILLNSRPVKRSIVFVPSLSDVIFHFRKPNGLLGFQRLSRSKTKILPWQPPLTRLLFKLLPQNTA